MGDGNDRVKTFLQDLLRLESVDPGAMRAHVEAVVAQYEKAIRDEQSTMPEKVASVLKFRELRRKRIEEELVRCESPKRKQLLQLVLNSAK